MEMDDRFFRWHFKGGERNKILHTERERDLPRAFSIITSPVKRQIVTSGNIPVLSPLSTPVLSQPPMDVHIPKRPTLRHCVNVTRWRRTYVRGRKHLSSFLSRHMVNPNWDLARSMLYMRGCRNELWCLPFGERLIDPLGSFAICSAAYKRHVTAANQLYFVLSASNVSWTTLESK